jgi:hypothetical protein
MVLTNLFNREILRAPVRQWITPLFTALSMRGVTWANAA